jgi:hypothetical protein
MKKNTEASYVISLEENYVDIQGLSGEIVNILGGGSMDYSE